MAPAVAAVEAAAAAAESQCLALQRSGLILLRVVATVGQTETVRQTHRRQR